MHCSRWANVAAKRIVTDFPIQLTLEMNTTCNLSCKMCMRRQLNLKSDYMRYGVWARLIGEGIEYKDFESIKPNYRNEPTLHPQLPKFLQYAHDVGVKEIIMNTNGKFQPFLVDRMAPYLTEIAFSLDATTKAIHKLVRPGGNLERIERNVMKFIEKRDVYRNLRVRVAFVIQDENEHQKDEFLERWKSKGADKIVINNCYNPQQKSVSRTHIKWRQKKSFVCPQIYQRLVVTALGEVLPCCGAYDESISLGNIFKEPEKKLYDFWHSQKMNNLRELHERGDFKDIPTCSRCALSYEVTE